MKIFNKVSVAVLVTAFTLGISAITAFSFSFTLAPGAVDLGTAGSFAVLAGSGIVSTNPPQVITGDAGSNPTVSNGLSSTTDFVSGTNYTASNAAVIAAKVDLALAYASTTATATTSTIVTELGGQTLTAGVYSSADTTFALTGGGTLTLDGDGNPNAVFIFKMGSTLTTGIDGIVALTGGAQACNVFWQVGSSATLEDTTFVGTILAKASITDSGSSTISGRFLADADNDNTGAVTLNHTAVTVPTCNPHLTVIKEVVGGGPKAYTDFPLFVDDVPVTTGVATTTVAGAHVVTETTDSNYTQTFSDSCFGGNITLASGQDYTCTITNTYVVPVVPVVTTSGSSGGGSRHYGCKDLNALNYEYFAASRPSLCLYAATSTPVVYPAVATTTAIVYKLPNTGINDGTGLTKEEAVVTFYRSLSIGAQGADVAALQTALEQKDLLTIPFGVSKGYFGSLTRKAVTKYQANVNLPTVGVFGPLTRARLTSELEE